jgi:hypothetical protein
MAGHVEHPARISGDDVRFVLIVAMGNSQRRRRDQNVHDREQVRQRGVVPVPHLTSPIRRSRIGTPPVVQVRENLPGLIGWKELEWSLDDRDAGVDQALAQ